MVDFNAKGGAMERKSVSILGATGSIGDSTLDLIRYHKDRFEVKCLSAGNNIDKFLRLIDEFQPRYVSIAHENHIPTITSHCPDVEILTLDELSSVPVDWTCAAIVGTAGLVPTMNAIKNSKIVAFASKECLVAAGDIMMQAVKTSGTKFLPVDSEHNAIYQVFENHNRDAIRRLILTCSGGPFLHQSIDNVTLVQAVAHPTWAMGAKISVDSATLMNKALEVIEAHYLFNMPSEKIDVVIHPQSLIHSMVEYNDGSILSQMGPSDMKTPIAYCLGWPERIEIPHDYLDFGGVSQLTFEQPDTKKFKSLSLVRDVMRDGQCACIIFNAANEIANKEFLDGQISFTSIYDVIEFCLNKITQLPIKSLDDVIEMDRITRHIATERLIEC